MDDSLPILSLLEAVLGKQYKVVSVSDGLAAMSWLSGGNKPDLIISDVQMPNVDGWELARHLGTSALYENIPIIILSGMEGDEIRQKCEAYGIYDYIHKPFDPVQLLDKVKNLFAQYPLEKKTKPAKAIY